MKTRMFLTLLAAIAAATAAASTRADDLVTYAPASQAKCRLVTGALRANFGTLDPASVSSQPQAAAMDYRCSGNSRAGGGKALQVALYWTVAAADGADLRTIATTYGTGGVLGFAPPAQPGGGFVSVVIAP